ncbi:hypothetical protein BpHYR1_039803 [Brachionus plicatilis]|uniref:Uncharacterized protein n=1 Tax=Brachionus plicatilis TaxID=10195 RepID=A0A3M7Q5A3_BRAPC|nr:hypothetical protein BpHYR1_039803 [Brachionus plicatilis]
MAESLTSSTNDQISSSPVRQSSIDSSKTSSSTIITSTSKEADGYSSSTEKNISSTTTDSLRTESFSSRQTTLSEYSSSFSQDSSSGSTLIVTFTPDKPIFTSSGDSFPPSVETSSITASSSSTTEIFSLQNSTPVQLTSISTSIFTDIFIYNSTPNDIASFVSCSFRSSSQCLYYLPDNSSLITDANVSDSSGFIVFGGYISHCNYGNYDLSVKTKIHIYNSFIRSIIEYGAPLWKTISEYNLKKLDSIQYHALRIINKAAIRCSNSELH